ncbi:MAG: lipoprotein [Termitinemataceae bacterium]|nr:MAG: lipoprotein [Termitinemataceae bacterium]
MKYNMSRYFCILIFFIIGFFSSCSWVKVNSISREDLWSMDIGRLEDEIDLFNIEGKRTTGKTKFRMRDGFFYISNGNGQKVVRYNSYSDLLFMIYNEDTNPSPLTLRNLNEAESSTRWAYPWPLREPGCIAVDSMRNIFVEDRIPSERHSYDRKSMALLDSVVLHFDQNGRFIEYLGQEGPGGTPFAGINNIYTSINDELVVVCHLPSSWDIYWFDKNGHLLYRIPFALDSLYTPKERFGLFPSLDTIVISPDERKIFLKVDYYREVMDETTNTVAGREPDSSFIWVVDPETGECLNSIMLPFYESVTVVNNKKLTENLFYSIFGAINEDRIMLYFPLENGFSLLLLSLKETAEQRRGFINVSSEELQFCSFDVSNEGILSAILATNSEVRVVWWRTDKLAREM